MDDFLLNDVNIESCMGLITPEELKREYPVEGDMAQNVHSGREEIKKILDGADKRMLFIIGPCSIHDHELAIDYATRLAPLREKYSDIMSVVMRVYFEKPRSTIGWKGLINDPHLNGTNDVSTGLRLARKTLLAVLKAGMPTATEFLDPIVPPYLSDLVTWAAIGARTTESQTHREMASGLSMPVGFKNSTDGNLQIAVDAMQSAKHPHHFLGIDQEGKTSVLATKGNGYGHVVLRGGRERPNYDPKSVQEAFDRLEKAGLRDKVMVDCSHANSNKKFERQEVVWKNIIEQRVSGTSHLMGMMLESNIKEGSQKLTDPKSLEYGVSITDACVSLETTERLLDYAHQELSELLTRRPAHSPAP